jgi:hypothetical protein
MMVDCSQCAPHPVSVGTVTERVGCSRVGVQIADVEVMDERHLRADRPVECQGAEVRVARTWRLVVVRNACEQHVMFLDEIDGRVLS